MPGPNEDVIRQAIVGSPFGTLLGVETVHVGDDRVAVRLPYRPQVTTVGDLPRCTTIGFTVSFLAQSG